MTRYILIVITLLSCSNADRDARLDARITELTADTERLSRELVDLRKTGAPAKLGTPADSSDALRDLKYELATAQATQAGLFDYLSIQSPANPTAELHLVGAWKSVRDGATAEVLHILAGGKLCGWRKAPSGNGREPFWGRWERHGRFLVELHDHWMGDHNEIDPRVRMIDAAEPAKLDLKDRTATSYALAGASELPALASHTDDRVERMSLPDWCLVPAEPEHAK